jgi:hypothetical protein
MSRVSSFVLKLALVIKIDFQCISHGNNQYLDLTCFIFIFTEVRVSKHEQVFSQTNAKNERSIAFASEY